MVVICAYVIALSILTTVIINWIEKREKKNKGE